MNNKKKLIIIMTIFSIVTLLGITFAFYYYQREGQNNNEIVTGNIYMHFNETGDELYLQNTFPETREEAFSHDDNVITFTVDAKNEYQRKDLYYGITLNLGDEIENKTRVKPEDIMIYLEKDGDPVVDGIRFNDWNEQRIWVEKIEANTTNEVVHNYSLRIWVDENVIISDTDPNADYPALSWTNHYITLKLSVDGELKTMNMPLSIETSDTYVENNKAYLIAKISNYYDTTQEGLNANDDMKLEITGTNDDIVFSYKDSEGNIVTETSETLDLNYLFNKNKTIEVQVFVTPKNDANGVTDINFKLTRNGEVVQNFRKQMNIYGNNFCLNNGFNKLYDCILASDSLATNVSTAISNIEAKGEPNLNQTAPTYTYVEDITEDVENVYSYTGQKLYFGDSYEFNAATGTFKLYNSNSSSIITDALSDAYKGYYTCGYIGSGYKNCSTIYRVDSTSTEGTIYTITKGDKITYKIASSIRSEVGLYKTEDDYGDSYFYRGDVTNNNVLLGGYYWKIVRTNGDNSIRLIYNGTTPNATGNATAVNGTTYTYSAKYPLDSSPIGARYADPTYVGYMYGKKFEKKVSEETTHTDIVALTKYYFGDSYEFDETTETFKLKAKELEPIAKTFSEMNETDTETGKKFYELYPYTCKSTSSNVACEIILQVNSVTNETTARVQYHSYSSVDKDSTRTNEMSSNAKIQLENWYGTNIVGKKDDNENLITNYIVDGIFCNDRGITDSTYNSGYLLNRNTFYASYTRLYSNANKTTSLKCSNDIRDKFSHTSAKGNAFLAYPVALITADEVALAGGHSGSKNENFYLRTDAYYWTMSPSFFYLANAGAYMWSVYPTGALGDGIRVASLLGLRPVINLSPNVLISSGDGSVENPFQLKLA